jgi:ATP-dependent Clp protease adaptor protein ClpS
MKNELNKVKTAELVTKREEEEPALYRVMLHHDEFTPMEYVLAMLERFFNLTRRDAAEVKLAAQKQGRAVCGLFSKDVAATKISDVEDDAASKEFPLMCSMEAA